MNKQIDLKFVETAINVKNQYFCTLINEINLEEIDLLRKWDHESTIKKKLENRI